MDSVKELHGHGTVLNLDCSVYDKITYSYEHTQMSACILVTGGHTLCI